MNQDSEHKNEEQILAYVFGKMSKDEIDLFEKSMDSDSVLKEEVLLRKSLYHSFNEASWDSIENKPEYQEIQLLKKKLRDDDFKTASDSIRNAEKTYLQQQIKKTSKVKLYYKLMAVSAIVILFITLPFLNQTNSTDLYNDYANWNELPSSIEKGVTNNATSIEGEVFYNSKQYSEAISSLEANLNNSDKQNTYDLLYLGASYFQTNELEQAHLIFDDLIKSNTLQSSYGYWFKLLMYLNVDDLLQAKKMLNIILENPDYYNHEKAKILYKELTK